MKPTIIINLKTYNQGSKVLKLCKTIEDINNKIIVGAQVEDIASLVQKTSLSIYSQHVDYQLPGRNTGFILPEGIKAAGATGVFLNHSEHRLDFDIIKKTVIRCKQVNLKVALFAKDLSQAKKMKKLSPDYLIIEPPELVAGKVSVSKAKPNLIKKISKKLKYPFIMGAGIKDHNDLSIAMKLGASGIAISSAITTAKNPKKALLNLLK